MEAQLKPQAIHAMSYNCCIFLCNTLSDALKLIRVKQLNKFTADVKLDCNILNSMDSLFS